MADITLVWGVPMIAGGAVVTAELANVAVDQCELTEDRFSLIAPDNYRQDFLEIKLWSKSGQELAADHPLMRTHRCGAITVTFDASGRVALETAVTLPAPSGH